MCAAILFWAGTAIGGASAAPFVPADPDFVLERLPARGGAEWAGIAKLHARLAAEPSDAATAAELARSYLELNRRRGDPRLVAYADRALKRWDGDAAPPIEVALARALIAQTEHRFAAARDELTRLVERAPRALEGWLALATIDTVQGRYPEARRSCARLVLQDATVAGACLAAVQLVTGEAEAAHRWLAASLDRGDSLPNELAVWLATIAAETAEARGLDDEAARHYAAALAAGGAEPSIYLLTSYADFCLRRGRESAVVELLEKAAPADSVLLRLAVAEARLGRPDSARIETLRYRLDLALRGLDVAHAREAAFFALYVENDAERALPLARANWDVQRELVDARLVRDAEQGASHAAP